MVPHSADVKTRLQWQYQAMNARPVEILDVIVDCLDPERLASFWAAVLGHEVAGRRGPYVWLSRGTNDLGVGFQRVVAPTPGENRLHIDIATSDLITTKQRIESLGGRRATGYEDGGFLVMADPEGNEFCVIPWEPHELDEEGCTDYLAGLNP
jgi:predicted enzyme related to lactoylglutathione lyase